LVDPRGAASEQPTSRCRIRFPHGRGGWVEVCFLFSSVGADSDEIAFAVVGTPSPEHTPTSRLAELELRLRHIGAEVRASGVLNRFESVAAPSDHPQLDELTSRQWRSSTASSAASGHRPSPRSCT
jgi:hypothetical protein